MCEKCDVKNYMPSSCEECDYNQGFDSSKSSGYIAGPCGQQHCWYSCTVCEYNNGLYRGEDAE